MSQSTRRQTSSYVPNKPVLRESGLPVRIGQCAVIQAGTRGGKDWGTNEAGMKQMDDNIGLVLQKIEAMGQTNNTIVVFTTDNGAEAISFPDGGVTPFKGQKGETWEGGYRAPMVVRWTGHIRPGTVKNQLFAALDWVPTLVDIAGGPKGDVLKQRIEAGQYPGIVRTTLDGFEQRDYLEGTSGILKSEADAAEKELKALQHHAFRIVNPEIEKSPRRNLNRASSWEGVREGLNGFARVMSAH